MGEGNRCRAIVFPSVAEAGEFAAPLLPPDLSRVRPFAQPPLAGAKEKIPPEVVNPARENGARPIDFHRRAGPNRGQCSGFPETAFVGLLRRIIMRMHHDRFGTINNSVSLRAAPARVFIVL